MRIRTGHSPEAWRDDGPAFARVQGFGGSVALPLSKRGFRQCMGHTDTGRCTLPIRHEGMHRKVVSG